MIAAAETRDCAALIRAPASGVLTRIPNSPAGGDFAHGCGEVAGEAAGSLEHSTPADAGLRQSTADAGLRQSDEPAQW